MWAIWIYLVAIEVLRDKRVRPNKPHLKMFKNCLKRLHHSVFGKQTWLSYQISNIQMFMQDIKNISFVLLTILVNFHIFTLLLFSTISWILLAKKIKIKFIEDWILLFVFNCEFIQTSWHSVALYNHNEIQ